jgi:xanthine/uracil permease
MEDKNFSAPDSLELIKQMIDTAKKEQKDDGKGWILWGWLLFAGSVTTFINFYTRWSSTWVIWNFFAVAAIGLLLYSVIRSWIFPKAVKVKTYTGDLFAKLNIGFSVFLILIIVSINTRSIVPSSGFAMLLGLYGFWMLIYGAALNFKPSIYGAVITFACAFAALFVPHFKWVMLLQAIAVLCGYIIPGHIANREFNRQKSLSK